MRWGRDRLTLLLTAQNTYCLALCGNIFSSSHVLLFILSNIKSNIHFHWFISLPVILNFLPWYPPSPSPLDLALGRGAGRRFPIHPTPGLSPGWRGGAGLPCYLPGTFSLLTLLGYPAVHGAQRVALDLITRSGGGLAMWSLLVMTASAATPTNVQQLSLDAELPYVFSSAWLRPLDKQYTFTIRRH